ncbi:hypothetical protein [Pseudomonas sp. PSE14]|uniref:hypothetical protein n=1 Tax=Pseudomonas sp. PSE14 TaxID=3016341 RepID=UPI0023D814B5|nr:hypothetical protein [Pseudomonas sp. PSE14]WEJ70445.1 hypothetical protein O6P39_17410 [Pseudomonas sp. PSE14]
MKAHHSGKIRDKSTMVAASVAFLISTGCVVVWLYYFHSTEISRDPNAWGVFATYFSGILTPILTFGSVLWAVKSLKAQIQSSQQDREIAEDEVRFRHAVECLERGFNSIKTVVGPDQNHFVRLEWLTSARWLEAGAATAELLVTDVYKELYESHKELWKNSFRELINPSANPVLNQPSIYGQVGLGRHSILGLEPHSVYVVFAFMTWNRDDEIDEVEINIDDISPAYIGPRLYLQGFSRD